LAVDLGRVESGADLTGLLQAWSRGEPEALERLAPLVNAELRQIARRLLSREGQLPGWQATDLLHEAYVRLLDWRVVRWQSRGQFFATTARMMRRVLVDAARARRAAKRGQGAGAVRFDSRAHSVPGPSVDIVALADALDALAELEPRPAQVVELRFFGGFSVEETAEALSISPRTVINDWNTARAWLARELRREAR